MVKQKHTISELHCHYHHHHHHNHHSGKLQRQETQTQPHPPPGNCHAISDKSKIKVRLLSASVPFEVNAGLFFWPWNFYPKSNSPLAIACLFERVHQVQGVLRGKVTNAEDKIIELDLIILQ